MPFIKKTNAKARKVFIGRTSELRFFIQHVLEPEDPTYHIISISGQGGVGKSTLLGRFIDETQGDDFKDYCRVAQVNERQTTPADIMKKFAEQLSLKGDFEKAFSQYKETVRRVQSEHEAKREALLRQAATDVAGSLAKTVPVLGGVLEPVAGSTVGYIWDEQHNRKRLKDAERLENPIGDLTLNFVKELNLVADASVTAGLNRIRRQRRVVLFFDTFEQLAAEAAPWLLDYFLEADISSNVVLIVAGRESIDRSTPDDPKRWLHYHDENVIHLISLERFTQDETRTYLAEREITDPTQVDTYWQLSRGLPLYLGLLTSNAQGHIDPTKDVVDNFLRWIPKKEHVKQRLALDAACFSFSRPFNQDDLAAFSYVPEQERPQLYLWLTGQPFVHSSPQDGRYIYHELARDLFCRYLYQRSPEECSATRRALIEYYRRLLNKKVKAEGKDVHESAPWLELTLALAHQLFLLADEGSYTQAVEQILDAYDHAGQTGEIVRVLRDLTQGSAHSQVSASMQQSAGQLLKYMELQYSEDEGAPQGFLAAVQYLLEQVANERSCSTELVASLYYQRGVAYERLKQHQRAIADYIQAITLTPKVAVYYGNRGNAYHGLLPPRAQKIFRDIADENSEAAPRATVMLGQLLEEQDDLEGAKACYQRALDSGDSEAVPRAVAALGLLLQLQGDLEGAKACYQRALDSGHPDWAPRATVMLGQLLEEQGDLVHLLGAAELEAFITMNGDNPAHDDTVRRRVVEAQVLALGAPAQGTSGTVNLLHCTVPVGDTTIAMLPMFTRVEHVVAAVQMNPAWQSLQMVQMEGSVISGDLEEEEWLGINPWSGHEFKLPPISSTNPGLVKKPGQNAYAGLKQFDHTLADFSRAIDLDSNNPPAYYTLKKYERAVADYSRVIDLVPHNVEYHRWRGNAYAGLKQFDQALADFSRAIDLDPNNVLAYMARGHTYYTLKEYERAVADYSRVIDLVPHSVEYHRWRGNAYAELKQFDQALADYSRAIDLDPPNALDYYNRGNAYAGLKQFDQALADFSRAIDLDPNNVLAYNERGYTYYNLKEYERAVSDYSRAIDLDPKTAEYYEWRGNAYAALKQYDQALADYTRAIELDPNNKLAYNKRGVTYYTLKKYERALADFSRVIDLDPHNAEYYNNRGFTYSYLKEYERALADLSRAIDLDPTYVLAYTNRGRVYLWQPNIAQAKADFARAVEIDSTYPLAALLVEWSSLSKQRGGIDMAERFEEIASIKPQESQEYIVLVCQAIALELRNKLEESLEEIDKAITLMPEKEFPYFWKGILSAYHTTPSDAKDAIESIQQALVLGLPPILLTPLYWLEHDRPDWFSQYARPLLDQYGV
jgi:tetratricopeptide (TPR) repeat protein